MFLCQGYLRRKRPFFDVFKMERRGRYGGKTRKEITHAFLMLPRSCLALVTRKKKGAFLVSYPNPWGASINQKGNEIIVDEDDGQGLHITNLRILINYYSKIPFFRDPPTCTMQKPDKKEKLKEVSSYLCIRLTFGLHFFHIGTLWLSWSWRRRVKISFQFYSSKR